MAYQLSPGVNWSEIDLTTVVPALSTSDGGFVGEFDWGPIDTIVTVSSENELVNFFGKPSANVKKQNQIYSFWSAANFLNYGQRLHVVRANAATAMNATDGSNTGILIKNGDEYEQTYSNFSMAGGGGAANNFGMFAAKYAGALGNSLMVSLFPASAAAAANSRIWTSWPYAKQFPSSPGTSDFIKNITRVDSYDEMHMIVIDNLGKFTGTPGTVLEKFAFMSKASDSTNPDGTSNYYVDVIQSQSKYIYILNHAQNTYTSATQTRPTQAIDASQNWGLDSVDLLDATNKQFTQTLPLPANGVGNRQYWYTSKLSRGVDGNTTPGIIMQAYDKFSNKDEVDVSLLMIGHHAANVAKYVIDNIIDGGSVVNDEDYGIIQPSGRKDCVVFISPPREAVINNHGYEADSIVSWINSTDNYSLTGLGTFSSYAVVDSGWKKQYDKYNDVYRWLPLNPDVAGCCARTDFTNDAWYSPAGLNRGKILNVTQLAWNPTKPQRDTLYANGVNPVIQIKGIGTVLFGDKTLTAKPSAFDRINVRRLFIVLEKAISNASKYSLFEFNDEYTRAQFVATIEPFLRDVKGKKGIYDYKIVCDETNNTPDIIDTNRFVGDIYIKPARSINFIQLNFIAVRTGVAFSEVVGKY